MDQIVKIRRVIVLVILDIISTFSNLVYNIRRSSFTFFFKFNPAHLHTSLTTEAIAAASLVSRMLGTLLAFFLSGFVLIEIHFAKLTLLSRLFGLELPRWAFIALGLAGLHLSVSHGAFIALRPTLFGIMTLFAFVTFIFPR